MLAILVDTSRLFFIMTVPNSLASVVQDHSCSHITLPAPDNVRLLYFCWRGWSKIEFHLIILRFNNFSCNIQFLLWGILSSVFCLFSYGIYFFLIVAFLSIFCILILCILQLHVSMHIIIFSQILWCEASVCYKSNAHYSDVKTGLIENFASKNTSENHSQ